MTIPLAEQSEVRRLVGGQNGEHGLVAFGLGNLGGWHQIATGRENILPVATDVFWAMDATSTAFVVKDRMFTLLGEMTFENARNLAAEVGNLAHQTFMAIQFFVQTKIVQIGDWAKTFDTVANVGQITHAANNMFNNYHSRPAADANDETGTTRSNANFVVDGTRIALSGYFLSGGTDPVAIQSLLTALWGSLMYSYHVHQN
ncbi:MAG: hypothetical protein SP1CHLAM54_16560 [Chlamydiia bacterium]|nr:hypothetical protein [Chlamydiia bacterium]MCH9616545.1 hypothetical protein [Chlamydiia bacterium]MCH9629275.1 hypothetical protein [Chlamydiia bacterium]